jgi:flagellar protein FlbT
MMYLDTPNIVRYHQFYWDEVKAVIQVAPSMVERIGKISDLVIDGQYYQALKVARELIRYEQELVSNACKPA